MPGKEGMYMYLLLLAISLHHLQFTLSQIIHSLLVFLLDFLFLSQSFPMILLSLLQTCFD